MRLTARLFAVLAVLTAVALLQGALCSDGAAAAGSPCAPLFAAEATHSTNPADECPTALLSPADQPLPANHLDDLAGIGAALLATLVLLVRHRRPGGTRVPPSFPARRSTTTPPLVQLCVSRT
ncbi:hypothetical protein SAMN04489729_1184 [Amycolatopsis lurida]|uniref:Uncharacterized protein n=1 Tax=Amycolatopsis lurida NRRL 2430 TaxID=1460371 RepID=A0A2P2FZW8_AMYLU|nr:hypothetical protein [Amycolatopsis lurida]KFU82271.1 hypothetical protein BB31_04755 [Amycolatopsis lurida NRRL 2430]SEC27286.1 hypothetical protein SAMN04489729_1184 [Amycolatopsis lurida]